MRWGVLLKDNQEPEKQADQISKVVPKMVGPVRASRGNEGGRESVPGERQGVAERDTVVG